jgi:hypothetical protein
MLIKWVYLIFESLKKPINVLEGTISQRSKSEFTL